MDPPKQQDSGSNQQMESIMSFVTEWFSLGKMKVLHGVSVLMSVRVNEWQYKVILNDVDDLMWEDLSEDWEQYVSEGGESPAW